jgi:hypothetical protein
MDTEIKHGDGVLEFKVYRNPTDVPRYTLVIIDRMPKFPMSPHNQK